MGLFVHLYVDPDKAAETVCAARLRERGEAAQRDSIVLLKNDGQLLPFRPGTRVYAEGIAPSAFAGRAETGTSPDDADVAVVRLHAPYDTDQYGIGAFFQRGTLDFPAETTEKVRQLAEQLSTAVAVFLERPAVLTGIERAATVVLGDFGSGDTALAEGLSGAAEPLGSLPFDLPSSAEAIAASREDTPFDAPAIPCPASASAYATASDRRLALVQFLSQLSMAGSKETSMSTPPSAEAVAASKDAPPHERAPM